MVKRSKRSTASKRARSSARGSGLTKTLNDAQRMIGSYVKSGSSQVNEAVSSFLSRFDTGHLLDALRKKTLGRTTSRRSTATRKRKTTRARVTRRVTKAAPRRTAAARTRIVRKRSSKK